MQPRRFGTPRATKKTKQAGAEEPGKKSAANAERQRHQANHMLREQ